MPLSLIQSVTLRKQIIKVSGKASANRKQKFIERNVCQREKLRASLVLFQGDAAPAKTGIPSKVSNFLEKKKKESSLLLERHSSLFRRGGLFLGCDETVQRDLSRCEMKRAHETAGAQSCYPVMRHASAEQPCTAWCDPHGTEVSVHCSGNGSFACCLSVNESVLSLCLITGWEQNAKCSYF